MPIAVICSHHILPLGGSPSSSSEQYKPVFIASISSISPFWLQPRFAARPLFRRPSPWSCGGTQTGRVHASGARAATTSRRDGKATDATVRQMQVVRVGIRGAWRVSLTIPANRIAWSTVGGPARRRQPNGRRISDPQASGCPLKCLCLERVASPSVCNGWSGPSPPVGQRLRRGRTHLNSGSGSGGAPHLIEHSRPLRRRSRLSPSPSALHGALVAVARAARNARCCT